MGGLQGVSGLLNQQQQPQAQVAPQQDEMHETPQQPQQQPQQQSQQQSSGLDPALDEAGEYFRQQIKASQPPPPSGGPIRQMLQNFFHGMGQSMMQEGGIPGPEQKVQQALAGLQNVAQTKAHLATMQSVMAESAPVPLIGIDDKPVMGPNGPITLPANQARSIYAAREAGMYRQAIQQRKDDAASPILTKEQAQAIGHPELEGQEFNKALGGLMGQQSRNDSAETVQELRDKAAVAQTQGKMDLLRQTQKYNSWKTVQDNQTKLQVAQMSGNKAPAAIMQTAAFANGGLEMLNDAKAAMDRLRSKGILTNVASDKFEDWVFGKGLVDPSLPTEDKKDIGKLRAAAEYTSSAAMRAHTGRSSKEVYNDFKNTMGINQGPDAWDGAMEETQRMLGQYSQGATDAAIKKLRGTGPPATPSAPSGGGFAAWKAKRK